MSTIQMPPFSENTQLVSDAPGEVPDEPYLHSPEAVQDFLERELRCTVLDNIAPYLFWICKRNNRLIQPLTEYTASGRRLVVSEDPGLHLLRNHEVIHIKPLPYCLLNWNFWNRHLCPTQSREARGEQYPLQLDLSENCRSAIGFVRTYARLIRHRSDFQAAKAAGLVPDAITYTGFQHFIHPFRSLPDAVVSPRYQYGHIRLWRLNLAIRILSPCVSGVPLTWWYHRPHWLAGQYIARFAAPLLFVFALLSLILSSMQVKLEAHGAPAGAVFPSVSAVFAAAVLVVVALLAIGVGLFVAAYFTQSLLAGLAVNRRWNRQQNEQQTAQYDVEKS